MDIRFRQLFSISVWRLSTFLYVFEQYPACLFSLETHRLMFLACFHGFPRHLSCFIPPKSHQSFQKKDERRLQIDTCWCLTCGFTSWWGENFICVELTRKPSISKWKRIPFIVQMICTHDLLKGTWLKSPQIDTTTQNQQNQLQRCCLWNVEISLQEEKRENFFIDKFDAVWHTFFRSLFIRRHLILQLAFAASFKINPRRVSYKALWELQKTNGK